MNIIFYLAATVAVLSTFMVITRSNAIHALLYLVVSLLAVALIFFLLGAPFVAALEVIIYAGAIIVLFVFAVMILNLDPKAPERISTWSQPSLWLGPVFLTIILGAELLYVFITHGGGVQLNGTEISSKMVGLSLYGPYLLGVEIASMLLLAGLVGAYHLGYRLDRKGE
jgi:NADH-quinone oxidoreductase subunit J